jgi:hypothetical protein
MGDANDLFFFFGSFEPSALGESANREAADAPEPWPISITLFGSPPKTWAFFWENLVEKERRKKDPNKH